MEEQQRRIRAVSEELERPYYTINYRLSLSGKELFTGALGGDLSPSACAGGSLWTGPIHPAGRAQRSRSEASPQGHGAVMVQLESNIPGTPRSQFRRSCQPGFDPLQRNDPDTPGAGTRDRRTRSVTTSAEIEVHRQAPPLPAEYLQAQQQQHRQHFAEGPQAEKGQDAVSVQQGLVTCLNSKNVAKYKVGQSYRRGVILGIDEEQGKIIVFHRSMPPGVLSVLRTKNSARYEKGYPVADAQGRQLGSVHAVDRSQNLLVVNTSSGKSQREAGRQQDSKVPPVPMVTVGLNNSVDSKEGQSPATMPPNREIVY